MSKIFEQLPPDSLEEALLIRKEKLEKLISIKNKAISQAPEGKLRISKNKGTIQYYLLSEKANKSYKNQNKQQYGASEDSFGKSQKNNGKYISKTNLDFIKLLAQKEYNKKTLPLLQNQLKTINQTLNILKKNNLFKILNSFSEYRKKLFEPATLLTEEYVKRWQKIEYTPKEFSTESPDFLTAKGERVRSKSEIIIADTLNRLGVPYHYEFPIELNNHIFYPDFYCLNSRTRQEFIWEHFGMMDNFDYACSATKKIKLYQENGYFLGSNFILTMETVDSPINSKQIEEIIKQYLL